MKTRCVPGTSGSIGLVTRSDAGPKLAGSKLTRRVHPLSVTGSEAAARSGAAPAPTASAAAHPSKSASRRR